MNKPTLINLQTMPLHKQIESSYGVCQSGSQVGPGSVCHVLGMAHSGEHGKHSLYEHASIPSSALTHLHVGGVSSLSRLGMEAGVGKHHHLLLKASNQRTEEVIFDVSRCTFPIYRQPPLVDHQTELGTHDPALVGLTVSSNLLGRATLPDRLSQFDAVSVGYAQHGRVSQETLC